VTSIEVTLSDVSTLPGVCMNYPPQAPAATRPDLRFEAAGNPGGRIEDDGRKVTFETIAGNAQAAQLSCYDAGGWATLRVRVRMADGKVLTGRLKDDGREEILLPKRDAGSKIADAFKESLGAVADAADDEAIPAGHHTGDGLTLFEEYRGFRIGGTPNVRGDPRRKDLFVVDALGGRSKAALAQFRALTDLVVRDGLRASFTGDPPDQAEVVHDGDEPSDANLPDTPCLVVNANHAGAPHVAKKSAILMRPCAALSGVAAGFGGPGHGKQLLVPPNVPQFRTYGAGRSSVRVDYYAATLAHELLHCCSVEHHGGGDPGDRRWVRGTFFGNPAIFEHPATPVPPGAGGADVQVTNEDGSAPGAASFAAPDGEPMNIARRNGQHSGAECVMRYDSAHAYIPDGRPRARVVLPGPEPCGTQLCDTPTASGDTATRYGDAALGNCRGQVCVNDAQSD
jgi:hypothetical protein